MQGWIEAGAKGREKVDNAERKPSPTGSNSVQRTPLRSCPPTSSAWAAARSLREEFLAPGQAQKPNLDSVLGERFVPPPRLPRFHGRSGTSPDVGLFASCSGEAEGLTEEAGGLFVDGVVGGCSCGGTTEAGCARPTPSTNEREGLVRTALKAGRKDRCEHPRSEHPGSSTPRRASSRTPADSPYKGERIEGSSGMLAKNRIWIRVLGPLWRGYRAVQAMSGENLRLEPSLTVMRKRDRSLRASPTDSSSPTDGSRWC